MGKLLDLLLLILGIATIIVGVWMIFVPAAVIVFGVILVLLAISPRNNSGSAPPKGGA